MECESRSRVVISLEVPTANGVGMRDYLVVHGRARITEGGAVVSGVRRFWHTLAANARSAPGSGDANLRGSASPVRMCGSHEYSSHRPPSDGEPELFRCDGTSDGC